MAWQLVGIENSTAAQLLTWKSFFFHGVLIMRKSLVVAVLILFCTSQLVAWHDAGHKLVGAIAFNRLTAEERTKVLAILKNHPRFTPEFEEQMPANVASGTEETQQEWRFQQAAVWPDTARHF